VRKKEVKRNHKGGGADVINKVFSTGGWHIKYGGDYAELDASNKAVTKNK